jgi:CcmD family protein
VRGLSVRKGIRTILVALLLLAGASSAAFAQPQQPSPANEGFVQANDLPPTEQLPAAPLVVAAYTIFLVLIVGYLWSIARRLNTVEKEMRLLEQRPPSGGAAR